MQVVTSGCWGVKEQSIEQSCHHYVAEDEQQSGLLVQPMIPFAWNLMLFSAQL